MPNTYGQFTWADSARSSSNLAVKGLIRYQFAPQLSAELERLFLPDIISTMPLELALPMPTSDMASGSGFTFGSAASSPGSSTMSPWDEFRSNGRDEDLDELDRLVRGMEVTTADETDVDPFPELFPSGYPALSTSPGSDSADSGSGSDSFGCGIVSRARLLEILREQERDRMSRRRLKVKGDKICVFCRNNGENEAVYSTHQLKDAQGRVTCPVLYIYTCPICGATGEHAHTIKYCPLNAQDRKSTKQSRANPIPRPTGTSSAPWPNIRLRDKSVLDTQLRLPPRCNY